LFFNDVLDFENSFDIQFPPGLYMKKSKNKNPEKSGGQHGQAGHPLIIREFEISEKWTDRWTAVVIRRCPHCCPQNQ